MHELDIDAISLQWWTQADDGSSTPWDDNNNQQARVCLVSSIRALSQSLFTDESTHVFIERAGDCGVARALASSGSDRYRRSPALPAINPDDLCAIAISKRTDSSSGLSPAGTHLRVDLSTLLTGVMVPHYATQRYKELVTKLVQESVWVTVTRASPPEASSNVFRLADNGTPKLSAAPRLNRLAPIAALPPQITHLRQP